MALDVKHYLHDCVHGRELDLLDDRLHATAEEIQEYIMEGEIDEKMQRLEARLLKAAGEIEHHLQVLERGLPLSANKAEASSIEG